MAKETSRIQMELSVGEIEEFEKLIEECRLSTKKDLFQ